MSISNGQYHSFLSTSHTCCSPACTTVDTWHVPYCSEARPMVSFIFDAPNESWSRNGEHIAEGKNCVFTGLLSTCMLLIAIFSCGSSGLLNHSFPVLAIALKADQINWLWIPKNCLPPVWSSISLADQSACVLYCNSCLFSWSCVLPSRMLFLAIDLRVLLLQRAVTVCQPDYRDSRVTQLSSSGCVWESQKLKFTSPASRCLHFKLLCSTQNGRC